MAQSEIEDAPGTDRRIRHVARDGVSAAALSLAASVLLTLTFGFAFRWLG